MPNAAESPRPLSPAAKAGRFLRLLMRPVLARRIGTLVTEGYLARTGWVRSVLSGRIVGQDGEPLPWMTYPFIDFIGPRLTQHIQLFEYGAGASTLFFSLRVGQVRSVEHDQAFVNELTPKLPKNARLMVRSAGEENYVLAINEWEVRPQVVIVDGLRRVECAAVARTRLAADGVLVLDDAQLPEYEPIHADMRTAGFRRLDFWGLAPGRVEHRCTTIFYRGENVLGL